MAPINIDNSKVTGVTIDGTDVQEITVDGDVVFTASLNVPSSAVHQWRYDEGSGSTVVDNIDNADGTFVGAPTRVSDSSAVGEEKISFDGVDDRIDFTVDIGQFSEWMLSFTIETTGTFGQEDRVMGWGEDGSRGEIYARNDPIEWNAGDGNGGFTATASTDVYDGTKHRVSCFVDENNEIGIAVDGSVEGTTSFGTVGPVSNRMFCAYFERNNVFMDVTVDHPIIYLDRSQPVIDQDFAIQPYS
jgi:hypothetical protein